MHLTIACLKPAYVCDPRLCLSGIHYLTVPHHLFRRSDTKGVKFLVIEFILEALPQMSVQIVNNQQRLGSNGIDKLGKWTDISIISMVLSTVAIVDTLYKYGYLYFCAKSDERPLP